MEKTVFPKATDLVQKLAEAELRIRDFMAIFAAIAFTQEDKMFSVPLTVIEQINGASVDFSFNRVKKEYEFTYIPAPDKPSIVTE